MPAIEPQKKFSIERRMRPAGPNGNSLGGPNDGSLGGPAGGPTGAGEILQVLDELRADIAALAATGLAAPAADGFAAGAEDDQNLRLEIAQMVRTIAQAKTEIASIKHPNAEDDQVGEATNELDAIVEATEQATNTILETSEEIERIVDQAKADHGDDETIVLIADQIGRETVKIFEACGFQDITGQRITKVIRTLRFIEARILAMIDIWGAEAFEDLPVPGGPAAHSSDENVSGPQLENQGISQAEIDALFD